MESKELVIKQEQTVQILFEKPYIRQALQRAIPKHMTVERLLQVAMTAIRVNPELLQCSQKSLLAAVMGCAQLGLEPEPFLGQAYFVPFKKEVVLIPGYRGYIMLARRSGEVQSLTSQVVYERDHFVLRYGTDEKLEHIPVDGDRGEPKGAYVVFKYKDGGYSFDYMSKADIERIRLQFSKQPDGLMWKENWDEGAKKTVIRRHIKIVPLAIELQRAAVLEDRAYGGESQFDMIFPGGEMPKENEGKEIVNPQAVLNATIAKHGIKEYDGEKLGEFIQITAERNDMTTEDLIKAAVRDFPEFWKEFGRWMKEPEAKESSEKARGEITDEEIIDQFKGLKHSGLMNWEKMHRDKLTGFSMEVQKAFVEKWKKVMGQTYHGRSEPIEPKEETEPGTEEGQVPEESKPKTEEEEREEKEIKEKTVECPNHGGELTLKSYCEDGCPDRDGCPVFE